MMNRWENMMACKLALNAHFCVFSRILHFFFPLFIFSLICVILFVIFHNILWKLYCMLFIGACLLIKEKGV